MAFEIEVKSIGFAKTTFYIDENILKFGKKEIPIKDITGFGYMSTQHSTNGINTSKTFQIAIWQKDDKTPTNLMFMGALGGGAANEKYASVTDQLWTYFGDHILKQLHKDLLEGKTFELASNIKLISKGIVIRRKPLFGSAYEALAPWNELNLKPFEGLLKIKCTTNKKATTTERFLNKNIWILYHYINWLVQNPEVMRNVMATPNNYRLMDKG